MIFATIVVLILIGCLIYLFLYGLATFVVFPLLGIQINNEEKYHYDETFDPEIEQILSKSFKYYKNLPLNSKPLFVARVREFMNSKEFIGKETVMVDNEMRTLISAAAIQLTFGLNKFMFDNFSKIFIYPKEFYCRTDKRYHVGETNLGGAIVFSWEDFKLGFSNETDNYNVGLHEMAHALRFDKFKGGDTDDFFNSYFDKFLAVGMDEFIRAKNADQNFLRKYAGTNNEEFFAVCMEYFFESSREMKQKLPELYYHLCILLNQDPCATFDPEAPARSALFKQAAYEPGELFYTSSLTSTWAILPFLLGFLLLSCACWTNLSGPGADPSLATFFGAILVIYIAGGGFTISSRFRKLNIYKNGIVISFALNPILKNIFLDYETILAAELNHSEYQGRSVSQSTDTLTITYTDGIVIKEEQFPIDSIANNEIETITAYLRKKKVMIKIFGNEWSHESIIQLEKGLPKNF